MISNTGLPHAKSPTRDEESPLSDEPRKPLKPMLFKGESCTNPQNSKDGSRHMSWRLEAGTVLEVRASHLLKLVCLLIVALAIVTITFHSRIRALESQKNTLRNDLSQVKLLVERMEAAISHALPYEGSQEDKNLEEESGFPLDFPGEDGADIPSNGADEKKQKVKRSASGRTTKDLHYQSSTISFNSLNNETAYDSNADGWTSGVGINEEKSRPMKGKRKKFAYKKYIRRLIRKELRILNAAHRLETPFRNISQSQPQMQSSRLSYCNDSTSPCQMSNISDDKGSAFENKRSCRAAYLQIDGSSVNIRKPKLERIGPWYQPSTGKDIGFNGMWYNNLLLDSNGTAIVFQEDGLFIIYAQVFYQLQHLSNGKPSPMGYRIYLKKNSNSNSSHSFRRPVPIAECVPSFPATFYQTCFTQVVWFVEAQDEIYLEHFMDSLPIIDALRSGQTFLGIVRL